MDQIQDGAMVPVPQEGGAIDAGSRADLMRAMEQLRSGGGLMIRLADAAGGMTVRFGTRSLGMVPGAPEATLAVVEAALRRAFDVAVLRLHRDGQAAQSERLSGPLVMMSGAVGGFIGLGGFVPDAAVTTLAIMREIARIALEEGEDLSEPEARAACLQVFALQAGRGAEAEMDGSYFTARFVMQGRPLAMLLSDVARRFGVTLSQKFALQAIPVVGAVAGASLNAAFLKHYRDLARAHFTIRRLERQFGEAAVRAAVATP